MQGKPVIRLVVLMLIASLACSVPGGIIETLAPGGTWYVTTSGNDSNDCLSEATACLTVPAAVAKAAADGVIMIGAGTFLLEDPASPGVGLDLTGKVLGLHGVPTDGSPETILNAAGAHNALWVDGSGVITLKDLIIQGGGSGDGATLSLVAGSPSATGATLQNVIIQGSAGDAIRMHGSAVLQAEDVDLINNIGYGIISEGPAKIDVDLVRISGNGGGMQAFGGEVTIYKTIISDNAATFTGPVIHTGFGLTSRDATVNIGLTTISGNGQGLQAYLGEVTISDTTIAGNQTPYFGQVFNLPGTQMRIEASTISDSPGDGIRNEGEMTIINSTIAENTGTGIVTGHSGQLKMAYSTVAGNGGSGLSIGAGSVTLAQDLIENNAANDCTADFGAASSITVAWEYVNVSDGSCAPEIFILASRGEPDAYLGPLADNGGPTRTMALIGTIVEEPSGARHYASRAINAHGGSISRDPELRAPETDQRGMPRPGPDGGISDVGAYEYSGEVSLPLVIATPGAEATATPNPMLIILDKNANCREGPGTQYDPVDAYLAGQSLQVDGRNAEAPWWWQVVIPNSTKHCWISSVAGMPPGDFTLLPVVPVGTVPDQGAGDPDSDGDGYPASNDCNDQNAKIHPGAAETPNDKVDSNCNGDDDK